MGNINTDWAPVLLPKKSYLTLLKVGLSNIVIQMLGHDLQVDLCYCSKNGRIWKKPSVLTQPKGSKEGGETCPPVAVVPCLAQPLCSPAGARQLSSFPAQWGQWHWWCQVGEGMCLGSWRGSEAGKSYLLQRLKRSPQLLLMSHGQKWGVPPLDLTLTTE